MNAIRTMLGLAAAWAALQAPAQAGPAVDYTDMWWNPAESGWGISIRQKAPVGGTVDALFAVWYTYDPRKPDTSTAGAADFVPLWLVMPGGAWTSPTTFAGRLYVLDGTPYGQAWNASGRRMEDVGSFTFRFSDADNGTFSYVIAPPAGLSPTSPAFGLTAASGVKAITRNAF
jgi:hypothetical protein